jgi:hypothetical protein
MAKKKASEKTPKLTDEKMNELDRALNAAKARKAKKSGATASDEKPATKAPKKSAEEREAAKAKREEEREAKKAEREKAKAEKAAAREKAKAEKKAAREAKKAEREAARKARTPHMGKVAKAAERLPDLNEDVTKTLEDLVKTYDLPTLTGLAAHIQHRVRVEATKASLGVKLEEGQSVTVIAGDPRYIGQTGKVSKVQRIRCYVELPGVEKPVYLFTADVTPATAQKKAAAAG